MWYVCIKMLCKDTTQQTRKKMDNKTNNKEVQKTYTEAEVQQIVADTLKANVKISTKVKLENTNYQHRVMFNTLLQSALIDYCKSQEAIISDEIVDKVRVVYIKHDTKELIEALLLKALKDNTKAE